MEKIRLGLLGAGLNRSQAPRLHLKAGELCDLKVSYELFDLDTFDSLSFESLLEQLEKQGFHGVNVTHPLKEKVVKLVTVPDKAMRKIGAINTLRLSDKTGYNTDYSGFTKAFLVKFGKVSIGKVLMLGAGGVGKAVAFALLKLDSNSSVYIVDSDLMKAETLAKELRVAGLRSSAHSVSELPEISGVDGLINCTPLGMYQYPGSAIPKELIGGQQWAFDAVYTPLETEFLINAKKAKLEILSGYELFFYQGLDAFEHFTGHRVDESKLRQALAAV